MPLRLPATGARHDRLQLFSDLHADLRNIKPVALADDVDVVVVAGDTRQGPFEGFELLRQLVPEPTPIVCVAGNHEHYNRCLPESLAEARRHAPEFGITFLEDATAVVCGVRFLGCTLWTDYALFGEEHRAAAMDSARRGLNDHRLVKWRKEPWERFMPHHARSMHLASRAFLERSLAQPFDGPTVVVTHHCPTPASVPERFERSRKSVVRVRQ